MILMHVYIVIVEVCLHLAKAHDDADTYIYTVITGVCMHKDMPVV